MRSLVRTVLTSFLVFAAGLLSAPAQSVDDILREIETKPEAEAREMARELVSHLKNEANDALLRQRDQREQEIIASVREHSSLFLASVDAEVAEIQARFEEEQKNFMAVLRAAVQSAEHERLNAVKYGLACIIDERACSIEDQSLNEMRELYDEMFDRTRIFSELDKLQHRLQ